jgi:penicillin-binding protein 1A
LKKYFFLILLGFFLTVFLADSFAGEADQFTKVENLGITQTAQRSYVMADNGTVLARLYLENREDVPLSKVPNHVQQAFVAIEDERYYEHHGVDYYGIARALVTDIKSGKVVEGGSTITQQYVKNSIGEKDRTVTRKLREVFLASKLEQKYSKRKILEAYLNTIYFGQGAYGIEAASEVFFDKKVSSLSLAEGALLAGVTKSPEYFSPYTNPEHAYERQRIVLDKMVKLHMITPEMADAAKQTKPRLTALKSETIICPHFVEYVKKELIDHYGVDKVFKGGLRVYTTLNLRAQHIAENAIDNELYYKHDPEAALVSINPKNGHIVAMAGGRNFSTLKYNLATQGKRQPGSSFKTFVLVTALKQGYSPNDMFDGSSPQAIRIGGPNPWIVHNCEGESSGDITLRDATVHSINAVYARLTVKVGPKNVWRTAHAMGITTYNHPYPSMGIGGLTVGVSPLEMASAYATLANGGIYIKPVAISSILDPNGDLFAQAMPSRSRAISPQVAAEAIDILRGVITRGTGTAADIGRPAAGKTGTNEEYRDAWFVGFTPNLATAVWMGYPQAQVSMYDVHGNRAYGGIIPASIWERYMKRVLVDTPASSFPEPKGAWDSRSHSDKSSINADNKNYSGGPRKSRRRSLHNQWNQQQGQQQSTTTQDTSWQTPQTTQAPPVDSTAPSTPSTQNNSGNSWQQTQPNTSVTPPGQQRQNQQNRQPDQQGTGNGDRPSTTYQQ